MFDELGLARAWKQDDAQGLTWFLPGLCGVDKSRPFLGLGFLSYEMPGQTGQSNLLAGLMCSVAVWMLTTANPDFTLQEQCVRAVTEHQKKRSRSLSVTTKSNLHWDDGLWLWGKVAISLEWPWPA